ncbi:MAG TPA: divalent metal cation transporter [Caulobacteraceae bacterium]|nr:divalent metal cation transporter [Caulobacteraceae bacterium]
MPKPQTTRAGFNPFTSLGPGLITGAADDDPSGIATYSQAGAQFGLSMLWTVVLTYPFMAVFQSVCGRIGRVTGRGLAANIKLAFPRWVLFPMVGLLLVANTLNIAADIAAMGESAQLVLGGPRQAYAVILALLTLGLQIFVPYHAYVRYLKWMTLALFAYVALAFTVHVPWLEVLQRTVLPKFKLDKDAATLVVAIFGTTISPYLFFWQASEEVEEIDEDAQAHPLREAPAEGPEELKRIGWDTYIGMFYSNAIAFFIMLSTAVTLNHAGATNIQSAAQAAGALRPLAGNLAFGLFSLGIIGTGLLAIPTLAGSAAYALSEAMGWKASLGAKFSEAHGFYSVIGVAIVGGIALGFSPLDPMKALVWSAVVNGVVAVPLMALIMILATRPKIMGRFAATPWQRWGGWIATAIMGVVAASMFVLN